MKRITTLTNVHYSEEYLDDTASKVSIVLACYTQSEDGKLMSLFSAEVIAPDRLEIFVAPNPEYSIDSSLLAQIIEDFKFWAATGKIPPSSKYY